MRQVNEYLLVYQYVHFCHAWALKHWALRAKFSLGKYVAEGIGLLVEPFLTAKGRSGAHRDAAPHRRLSRATLPAPAKRAPR